MDINIDDNLVDTLNTLAEANSTTPEEYCANVLYGHLNAALKKSLISALENRPADEVINLASTLKSAAQAIDDAKPRVAMPPYDDKAVK